MRIYLDIDDNQIIQDVKFKTFGCGAAVATSSMATEMVKRKNYPGSDGSYQQSRYGGTGRTSRQLRYTVLCSQRRQFTLLSGIMLRRMALRSKDSKKPKTDIGEEEVEEEY